MKIESWNEGLFRCTFISYHVKLFKGPAFHCMSVCVCHYESPGWRGCMWLAMSHLFSVVIASTSIHLVTVTTAVIKQKWWFFIRRQKVIIATFVKTSVGLEMYYFFTYYICSFKMCLFFSPVVLFTSSVLYHCCI